MDEGVTQPGRRWAWLPAEVPWLLGLAGVFWWLSRKYWDLHVEGLVYDRPLTLLTPWLFVVAAAYAWLRAIPQPGIGRTRKLRWNWLFEAGLAYLCVWYVQRYDPILYVDDAGFILRYFDHFSEGCFYCFNVSEGPVFGISSFMYGLVGGFLCWTHVFDSEGALDFLTYAGIFGVGFMTFRVLRQVVQGDGAVLLLWFLVMTSSHSASLGFNSGMEGPFHLSIVLLAVYFFLKGRDRWMWLFMALSVISKLDAVPIVVVIALMWTVQHWRDLLQFDWRKRRYADALTFGLLPVVVWIVFAVLVFGSPLPQSAYSKVTFHNHAVGGWFPFLDGLMATTPHVVALVVGMVLFIAQVGFVAARRAGGRQLVFGFGFVATMLLYYFYNPGERMLWYYVLPECLLLLQLAAGLHWLWGWLPAQRAWRLPLVAIGLVVGMNYILSIGYAKKYLLWMREFESTIETERMRVGDYLAQVVAAEDTLLAGHGLIGRKVQGLVLDQTGLNSKLATRYLTKNDSLAHVFVPAWIVMHGNSWDIDKLNDLPYVLDTSFYDVTTYGYPTWRVLRRVASIEESAGNYFFSPQDVQGDEMEVSTDVHFTQLKAKAYAFTRWEYNPRDWKLSFGLLRHEADYKLIVRDLMPGGSVAWEKTYLVPRYAGHGTPRIFPVTVPLLRDSVPSPMPEGHRYITLQFEDSYGKVALYDPSIAILRRDP